MLFHKRIESVEIDIGQDRGNDPPLWRAGMCGRAGSSPSKYPARDTASHQVQEPLVVGAGPGSRAETSWGLRRSPDTIRTSMNRFRFWRTRPVRGLASGGAGASLTSVVITRPCDPLEGQELRVLGPFDAMGGPEGGVAGWQQAVDPQIWTDAEPDAVSDAVSEGSTLGSLEDLLAACALVAGLAAGGPPGQGQAACKSPSKEDFHAACPAQFDTRAIPEAGGGASRATAGAGHRPGDPAARGCDREGRPARGPGVLGDE